MPLILLDRDGVINKDLPQSVRSLGDFEILPGACAAIARLTRAGYKTAVVTNQAVVGRGEMTQDELARIHTYLQQQIDNAGGHLDHIYVCTDTQIEPHMRRKPAPGMLIEAMEAFSSPAHETLFIGDADRDMEAAYRAGCRMLLVRTGKGEKTLSHWQPHWGTPLVCDDLDAAVTHLLSAPSFWDVP